MHPASPFYGGYLLTVIFLASVAANPPICEIVLQLKTVLHKSAIKSYFKIMFGNVLFRF